MILPVPRRKDLIDVYPRSRDSSVRNVFAC